MKKITGIKNYNLSADIIRILAAFFVIFSHSTDRFVMYTTLNTSSAWHIIYYMNTLSRIAVPLFVVLSGYLLLNREKITTVKTFYNKRFSRVLYPFIIWLIIYYLWEQYFDQVILTPGFIFQSLWGAGIWHLYFLIIIMELYLITPLIEHFNATRTRKQQTILFWSLLALSVVCSLIVNLHINIQALSLTIFIPYLGYYYAGGYLREVKVNKLWTILFLILYLILAYVTNLIANGNTTSYIIFNFSPTLLPMTLFLFLALKDIHLHFKKDLFSNRVVNIISYVGRTTFGIYLLHFLVLDIVLKNLNLYPWQLHAPLVLWAIVPALITSIITFIAIALIRLLPYSKYFVG
ncbi:MAG TPA: acyltransferase family protein [Candidatus Saccharimonadales bacterium]|nr:acyltransferase family protein [Candidatus Saccharimonadales bacterium]